MAEPKTGPAARSSPKEAPAFVVPSGGSSPLAPRNTSELDAARRAAILADMKPASDDGTKPDATVDGPTGHVDTQEQEQEQSSEEQQQEQSQEQAEEEQQQSAEDNLPADFDPTKEPAPEERNKWLENSNKWLDKLLGGDPKNADLKKRLGKIFSNNGSKNDTIKDLEKRLETANSKPPVVVAPSARDPLSHIVDTTALGAYIGNEQAWRDWCELHMPEAEPDPETGEERSVQDPTVKEPSLMTRKDVMARLQLARRRIEAAPARQKWLEQYAATQQGVKKLLPELYDESSGRRKEAIDMLTDIEQNGFTSNANYERRLAAMMEGERVLKLREQGINLVELKTTLPKPAAGTTTTETTRRAAPVAGAAPGTAPRVRAGASLPDTSELEARAARGDETARRELLKIESGISGRVRTRAA